LSTAANILEHNDGDQAAFDERFSMEKRILGEGEFGQVKLVYDKNDGNKTMYACKILRKGSVFKDNILYMPLSTESLRAEVDILISLNGKNHCLEIRAVFETPNIILMVTDCCSGGEMVEYVSKQKEDLRTEDISRIAYQLLSAIDHCAKSNILHRDIKPENIMFLTEAPNAALKLIDFGSGTNRVVDDMHTTYAGTAFYNSPEMFKKTYTSKTDVWSTGAVLYVLVAGYPSECLQKAFNTLQNSSRKSIEDLPNLPENMPREYYEMLEDLLVYRQKQRKSASDMLSQCAFVNFHKNEEEDICSEMIAPFPRRRGMSISVVGSLNKHSVIFDFKKFERKITTILAVMLSPNELSKFSLVLNEGNNAVESIDSRLKVVEIREIKDILEKKIGNMECLSTIQNMIEGNIYDNFSYNTTLLKVFSTKKSDEANDSEPPTQKERLRMRASISVPSFPVRAKPSSTMSSPSSSRPRSRHTQSVMHF